MPDELIIPKPLTLSNWSKNKGIMAKFRKTGIESLMGDLAKCQDGIDWALFNLRSTRDWTGTVLAEHKKKACAESKKLKQLKKTAENLAREADGVAKEWKASTFVSKDDRARAELLAKTADDYATQIGSFRWEEDYETIETGLSAGGAEQKYTRAFDIARMVNAQTRSRIFILENAKVETYYTLLDMGGKDNAYISAVIGNAITDAVQKTVDSIVLLIKRAEKIVIKAPEDKREWFAAPVKKKVNDKINEMSDALDRIPHEKWSEYIAARKQYKEYKIKSGKKVAKASVKVVLNAITGAMASGPMAIVGSVVSGLVAVAKLGVVLYELAKEAETVGKSVEKTAQKMLKEYETSAKKEAYLNLAIDTLGIPLLNTAKKLDEEYTLWQDKTAGLHYNAGKTGKLINPLLNALDNYAEKGGSADIDELEKKLNKALVTVSTLGERYLKNMAGIKKCSAAIKFIMAADKKTLGDLKMLPEVINLISATISLAKADDVISGIGAIMDLKEAAAKFNKAAGY
jgi:hypothetical protein